MADLDLAAFRAEHAEDRCICGHARRDHYARDGASGECRRAPCICQGYALNQRQETDR
ncbi:hypothetical protein [Nocardioides sp. MH1]|uniref:hypothetical protein n=1 Tax=Nocardioides sp. MH1 TaxID=3242490 RepID=UPI00351FA50E